MRPQSVADQVQRAMERKLLEGTWGPGMRLPPERVLADTLQVSRSSLREAIARLKARGFLTTRQGSGVFVTDLLQPSIASPWQQLIADHPDLRWDTLEFRRELEGATAQYAAMRASKTDLIMIEAIIDRLNNAYDTHDKPSEYRADADFHEAISVASHNSMFRYLHAGILRMLREHISLNLQELHEISSDVTAALRHQHNAIWNAIRQSNPDLARKEMLTHIDFTWTELARFKAVAPAHSPHAE